MYLFTVIIFQVIFSSIHAIGRIIERMFLRTLIVFGCVLSIIHTNGQYSNYGNLGYSYNGGYRSLTGLSKINYGLGKGKVRIEVYYEALCPACKKFDTHELKETVLELGPYLDIELHPYGNAKTIDHGYGNLEFKSQHGPEETYGNKLHACAIDILQNTTTTILFNSCLMDDSQPGQGSNDVAADFCGSILYVNSNAIKQCAKSNRGSQLLKYHGEVSKMNGFKSVPTVLVNGVPTTTDHFKEVVYRALS